MAVEHWFTQNGSGTLSGTSFADAAPIANAGSILSAIGTFTDHHFFYFCGDMVLSSSLTLSVSGNGPEHFARLFVYGRDAATGTINQPISIGANGGSFSVIRLSNVDEALFWNLKIGDTDKQSGNHALTLVPLTSSLRVIFYECRFHDSFRGCEVGGDPSSAHVVESAFVRCLADNNADVGFSPGIIENVLFFDCEAHSNGSDGFAQTLNCWRCLSWQNGGHGFNDYLRCMHCTSDRNTLSGFKQALSEESGAFYCASTNNGRYGWELTESSILGKCASFNNTLGRSNVVLPDFLEIDPVILAGEPWKDGLNGKLESNDGFGAALRGTDGILFPDGVNISYHDIGASQHCCGAIGEQPPGGPWALEHLGATLTHLGRVRKRAT